MNGPSLAWSVAVRTRTVNDWFFSFSFGIIFFPSTYNMLISMLIEANELEKAEEWMNTMAECEWGRDRG